ncbi:RUN domain-containing protein 1 [Dermacentor variabilis]|uniref:RUN domain-containing protein 1 n=1 Tax=Dermacentor variabilis TaxID=34621 RepID=UPI003F5B09E1
MDTQIIQMESLSFDDTGRESPDDDRPPERWAPVGSSEIDDAWDDPETCSLSEFERLRHLEEEQEQLNTSLVALTTHFAQVQFRLRQIVNASQEEKEELLKELEEFAFRGIPDLRSCQTGVGILLSETEQEQEEKLEQQRQKQKELIQQLKEQLEDLEKYAFETGDAGMPSSMLLERQSVIIEHLKEKLPLNLDELDLLDPDDLRRKIDQAVREMVNPVKMKEQLVSQLKTQITDLERFIQFIQGEGSDGKPRCTCNCPVHGKPDTLQSETSSECFASTRKYKDQLRRAHKESQEAQNKILRRMLALLHMFALTQFGCGRRNFQRNIMKRTPKGNHWGDLRACLELAINQVLELVGKQESQCVDSDYTSDSEDAPAVLCNEKLTSAVRKDLATALRDLMQHGLMEIGQSSSLVPLGCFTLRSASAPSLLHAWDLILKYYEIKNGAQYNASPARKLSESFNLDIVASTMETPKHALLTAVHSIISSHTPLKRSYDSHFKAFVCAALNEKRLVAWLKLLFKCIPLVERYYVHWSYVRKTGFDDALRSLDRLTGFDFDLPVDLAVRQLQNIKDAF